MDSFGRVVQTVTQRPDGGREVVACARMCVCVGDKQGRTSKGELAHGEPVSVG